MGVVEHNGIGGHDCAAFNDRPMQHHCAGGHLGAVVDGAGLEMGDVADHAVVPDDRRLLRCRVDDRVVLDARTAADLDVAVVAAKHCPGPNGRLGTNSHVPDDHCVGMDESGRIDGRSSVTQCVDRHGPTVVPCGIPHFAQIP